MSACVACHVHKYLVPLAGIPVLSIVCYSSFGSPGQRDGVLQADYIPSMPWWEPVITDAMDGYAACEPPQVVDNVFPDPVVYRGPAMAADSSMTSSTDEKAFSPADQVLFCNHDIASLDGEVIQFCVDTIDAQSSEPKTQYADTLLRLSTISLNHSLTGNVSATVTLCAAPFCCSKFPTTQLL